ncbi:ArdC-like ssDNA-binding domain-containing protein [Neolewinella xylanilytica]|uniref:ArdC-like ssDNA-binding domain-containing protein n=1 Tax=Neolewinella xylanilytica TaxID=1514080 RepID=UPI0014741A7B
MQRDEIYQSVTNTIIDHLKSNLEGFQKPWINVDHDNGPARNPSRGNAAYRGINQFILSLTMMSVVYPKNRTTG